MSPRDGRKALGKAAEDAAARFLAARGYSILHRNFSTRVGELDIIALDGKTLCFVEVRSRSERDSLPPYLSVGPAKQGHLRAAASLFLASRRLGNPVCRFDVVSIIADSSDPSGWSIELLRDAF